MNYIKKEEEGIKWDAIHAQKRYTALKYSHFTTQASDWGHNLEARLAQHHLGEEFV